MRYVFAVALAVVSMALIAPAWADSASGQSTMSQAGYGAGSALGTVVYVPFKATFCILGGLASAPTAIASPSTASKMMKASCGGTWVISPDVLQGQEKIHFVGESTPARAAAKQ